VFFLFVTVLALPIRVFAQIDIQKQVVVKFDGEVIQLPTGQSASTTSEVQVFSTEIDNIFSTYGVVSIEKAFPSIQPNDTWKVSRTGELVEVPDLSNIYVLTLEKESDVINLIDELKVSVNVKYSEKVNLGFLLSECPPPSYPNDDEFENQWNLNNCVNPGSDINILDAWDITTGSSDILVGIVDSGVELDHDDFGGKATGSAVYNENSHGTRVAGVVAAIGNNTDGIAGISWGANIYSREWHGGDVSMANAITGAAQQGVDVINLSATNKVHSETLLNAINYAYSLNIPVVVSAGNASDHVHPADYFETITVAATTINDEHRSDSRPSERIDVSAPGDPLPTTTIYNTYGEISQTSAATPHVTGVAALLLSVNPNLSIRDIREILQRTAVDVNSWRGGDYIGWDQDLGWGRIDATAALEFISQPFEVDKYCQTGGYEWWVSPELEEWVFGYYHPFHWGAYNVKVHAINLDVSFPHLYAYPPQVWGDWGTRGTKYENPHETTVSWCGIIEGTLTNSGCTLRTYYFDPVYNGEGENLGRYPANSPRFCWTVVGVKDLAPPQVTVIDPNGGEIFDSLDEVEIRWHVEDEWLPGTKSYVAVGRELDDGTREFIAEWNNQSVNSNGNGSVIWTVPMGAADTISTHFINVITYDSNARSDMDESDGFFTIRFKQKPADPGPPDPRQDTPVSDSALPVVTTDYLNSPYPNPFNPETMISFGISEPTNVFMDVYDVSGNKIRTIYHDRRFDTGDYTVHWKGRTDSGANAANGVYFIRFIAGDFKKTVKVTLLK
jgi:hypothetical protein